MKFLIQIKETLARTISVKANTKEEAIEIVSEAYHDSKIVLDADDFLNHAIRDVSKQFKKEQYDLFPQLGDYYD